MYVVEDRAIAILRPRQPFLDWLNQLPGSEAPLTLDDVQEDCTVMLIPGVESPEDGIAYIDDLAERIFDLELASWCSDEALWPTERTQGLFWRWFEVEVHCMLIDTVEDENSGMGSDYSGLH